METAALREVMYRPLNRIRETHCGLWAVKQRTFARQVALGCIVLPNTLVRMSKGHPVLLHDWTIQL